MNALRRFASLLVLAARRGLAARFDHASIRAVIDDALADYEAQRPHLPRETSLGGRVMVHLAALTIGLYRALLDRGIPEEEARDLTARVTSQVYNRMATVPTVLSGLLARSTHDRVRRATDLFRRFPFSAPSYDMVDVAGGSDVVAFDVRRCPVAEYFRAQGLGDLCVESWCNLGFPLAERWGARLDRRTTIAGGATHCDFRWRVRGVERAPAPEALT
jgi:hypothetical protein